MQEPTVMMVHAFSFVSGRLVRCYTYMYVFDSCLVGVGYNADPYSGLPLVLVLGSRGQSLRKRT